MTFPCASLWARTALIAPVLILALAGCSAVTKFTDSVKAAGAELLGTGKPQPHPAPWKRVTVAASADANLNSPVALDLVFVRDAALLETLANMPAAKWFATRDDTQRAFPDGVGVISLEVVPGQTLQLTDPAQIHQRALAILAFAAYSQPGEHRERLKPTTESYLLQLGPKGFKGADVHFAK
jgi:type VI secretion system protein